MWTSLAPSPNYVLVHFRRGLSQGRIMDTTFDNWRDERLCLHLHSDNATLESSSDAEMYYRSSPSRFSPSLGLTFPTTQTHHIMDTVSVTCSHALLPVFSPLRLYRRDPRLPRDTPHNMLDGMCMKRT